MKLTNLAISKAKPRDKAYKLFDGGGMFLAIQPSGRKWWRLKYRFGGKEQLLSLGTYPQVNLKQARERRESAKKQLEAGINPSLARKIAAETPDNSFEAVAREWFVKNQPRWVGKTARLTLRWLEKDVFPWIGALPISEVEPPLLLKILNRLENRGVLVTAHRVNGICGQIFRYAIANGHASRDPSADLRGALIPATPEHHPTITDPKKVGELLRAIDGFGGSFVVKSALWLSPLVFVRPGELRKAEWDEIDGDRWRIPPEKMKLRRPHIVPLSRQSRAVLDELRPLSSCSRYVFPSARTKDRPMSGNTINASLRSIGYASDQMCGHGFRSMATTLLNEQGWNRDVIERQLAHAERNSVRAAYNYAEYLPERGEMMQAWADYLGSLKNGASVVPIRRKA